MQVELLRNPREGLLVPESALLHQGRDHFVLRIGEGNKAERRQVRIGARRPGEVEIVEGLAAGDKVITHGSEQGAAGQAVRIQGMDDGTKTLRELLEPGQ